MKPVRIKTHYLQGLIIGRYGFVREPSPTDTQEPTLPPKAQGKMGSLDHSASLAQGLIPSFF